MKKLLSLVLTFIILLSLAVFTTGAYNTDATNNGVKYIVSANEYEAVNFPNTKVHGFLGDTNGDKEVSIMDATKIQLYMAQLVTLDATAQLLADSDRDGYISVLDATAIQLYMAKLPAKAMVAHTLYEIVVDVEMSDIEQQVVCYLLANGTYDEYTGWCYVHHFDKDINTSLLYKTHTNEISIVSDVEESSVYVSLSANLEKSADAPHTYLAYKVDENYETVYYATGEVELLKSADRKLKLINTQFDTETSLTFADSEAEIQEAITLGIDDIENMLCDNLVGSLYSLFA